MKHTLFARALTRALWIGVLPFALAAADLNAFTYSNFSSLNGLSLVGNAVQLSNAVRLTSASVNQSGAVWYVEKQLCASGFSTSFRFRMSNPGSILGLPAGGDGIAFSIQNVSSNTPGTEYGAYSNNIGITLNTFFNFQAGEPSANFVGIITNRDSVGNGFYYYFRDLNGIGINLKDGNEHNANIQYDGNAMTMTLDGIGVFTNLPIRINSAVDTAGKAWVGFSARCGSAFENHDILGWSFAALPVNRPPVASAQSVSLDEDTTASITLTGSDPDNDPLTYSIGSGPSHGTLSGTAPNLVYRPATNYFGPDSFTFKVNDGQVDSAFATVSINVRPINDAPVAQSQSVSLDEDTTLAITLSASDADGGTLTYSVLTGPAHGSLTGTAPDLIYHPATNYFGPDSITFKANDGQADSATAQVTITVRPVNDAPVAVIKVSPLTEFSGISNKVVIARNCGTTAEVVLDGSGSSDVENDPLTYRWYDGTNLIATSVLATNQLESGTHDITLVVSDGMASGSQKVAVEVLSLSDAVGLVIEQVDSSPLVSTEKFPLIASLSAAQASFARCNLISARNQMEAFENKVQVQIASSYRILAEDLIQAAEAILDTIDPR